MSRTGTRVGYGGSAHVNMDEPFNSMDTFFYPGFIPFWSIVILGQRKDTPLLIALFLPLFVLFDVALNVPLLVVGWPLEVGYQIFRKVRRGVRFVISASYKIDAPGTLRRAFNRARMWVRKRQARERARV